MVVGILEEAILRILKYERGEDIWDESCERRAVVAGLVKTRGRSDMQAQCSLLIGADISICTLLGWDPAYYYTHLMVP